MGRRLGAWMVWVALSASACGAGSKSCRTAYVAPARAPSPFLWQVTGPSGSVVLFGTHQAAAESDIPEAAWRALREAQVFVAEVEELGNASIRKLGDDWFKFFRLPEGESLQRMLSTD